MHLRTSLLEKLEASLTDTSDVYIGTSVDAERYLADLTAELRASVCEPFPASATVMSPGFQHVPLGSIISGMCLARRDGYSLVYQTEEDRFYCFWGTEDSNLGAHGVSGSPLHCWSS